MRKIINKIKFFIYLFVITFSIFSNVLTMTKFDGSVYAQSSEGMNSIDILKNYQLLEWLLRCEAKSTWKITGEIGKDSNSNEHTFLQSPGGAITELEEPVGHIAEEGTGTRECNSTDGSTDIFKAIGYSYEQWRDEFYTYSDDIIGNGEYDIKDGSDAKMLKIWQDKRNYWKSEYEKVKQVQYIALLKAFKQGCGAKEVDETLKNAKDTVKIDNFTNEDGTQTGTKYFEVGDKSGSIAVGYGLDADGDDDGEMTCTTITAQMNKLGQEWADYKKTAAGQQDNSSINSNSGDGSVDVTCESNFTSVGWMICPLMKAAIDGLGLLETAIQNQLTFDLDNINGTNNQGSAEIQAGSDSIKIIANTAFAIGILWIVLSQAITGGGGGGFFGAYEAKKVLPKLIAGVIVANFSWDLVNLMLKMSNSLGAATKSIMLSPFGGNISVKIDSADTWSLGLAGLGTGVAVFFGFFAISPILIAAAVAVIIGYFALIFRKAVIIALVTFAPIALVISPFAPNITKRWMNMLRNMIFMYPIIMAMISAFAIMAHLLDIQAQATSGIPSIALKLAAIASLFAPYFMIVTLFKIMGDILGKLAGSAKSMGDGFGKNFGQRRLEGNEHRVKRELLKNARKNQMHKSAYRDLVNDAQYEGRNPYKRFKKGYIAERQAQGSMFTKSGREERKRTKKSNQYELTAQDEKLSMEAGQAAISAESVSSFDPSKSYTIKDKNGQQVMVRDGKSGELKPARLENKMDLQRMLAEGHTVDYSDVTGKRHILSGEDSDVSFAAAMSLGQAGDVSQVRKMMASENYNTRKLAKIAVASNEGAFIGKAPDLTSKPNKIAFGEGLTYNDVSGWHGSTVDEAVNFQSQTANFLSDENLSKYEAQLSAARVRHESTGLKGDRLEEASRSDADSWAAANLSSEWSEAHVTQAKSQKALRTAMDSMKNDPRRSDTKNQDKIDKYEKLTKITL